MAALRGLYRTSIPPPLSHRDLTHGDLSLLASILAHQPAPSLPASATQHKTYAKLTKSDIEKLPPHLRRLHGTSTLSTRSALPTLLNRNSILGEIRPTPRELCQTHSKLNYDQVHSILRWVKKEVDINIPAILLSLAKKNMLPAEYQQPFRELREISGMWLYPTVYRDVFDEEPRPRWARQTNGCSACILARFGGDAETLVALKAGMIVSSHHLSASRSTRHAFIDALISNGFGTRQSQEIMQRALSIGNDIRRVWKRIVAEKRLASKGRVVDEPPGSFHTESTIRREDDGRSSVYSGGEPICWDEDSQAQVLNDVDNIYEDINNIIDLYCRTGYNPQIAHRSQSPTATHSSPSTPFQVPATSPLFGHTSYHQRRRQQSQTNSSPKRTGAHSPRNHTPTGSSSSGRVVAGRVPLTYPKRSLSRTPTQCRGEYYKNPVYRGADEYAQSYGQFSMKRSPASAISPGHSPPKRSPRRVVDLRSETGEPRGSVETTWSEVIKKCNGKERM